MAVVELEEVVGRVTDAGMNAYVCVSECVRASVRA